MDIRFLAIDGFNLIRRIFEARHVTNDADMAAVIEASKSSVQRAINRHQPTHAAVVLEAHDRTWRHVLYQDYKATRGPTPQLLLDHLNAFSAAFQEIKVTSCAVASYEADDVIATITEVVASHGGFVVILSTDKVYLQLINERVSVVDHFNDRVFDQRLVEERYQIKLPQYLDYLALVGDKSNNVKGVPGIGPKTAVELLSRYNGLDEILGQKDDDTRAMKVRRSAEEAKRCRQLVTLKTDVELGRNLKSFRL